MWRKIESFALGVLVFLMVTTIGTPVKSEEIPEQLVIETGKQVEIVDTNQIEDNRTESIEEAETFESTDATTFKVTAYCPCVQCCGKTNGITATGTVATAGRTIAVDPKVIPYGSKVILNGVTYIAEDCGGAIKGNKIDIFFDTHQEALEWGVKYLEGVVIG